MHTFGQLRQQHMDFKTLLWPLVWEDVSWHVWKCMKIHVHRLWRKKAPKTLLINACSVGWSPWLAVKRFSSNRETGLRFCGLAVVPVLCCCDLPLGMCLGVNPVFWQQEDSSFLPFSTDRCRDKYPLCFITYSAIPLLKFHHVPFLI